MNDWCLQLELRAARQADLGDERRRLAMCVIVVSIELGAGFDLNPSRRNRPRVCRNRRSLGLGVVRIGLRCLRDDGRW